MRLALGLGLAALLGSGCGGTPRRFDTTPVVWVDEDDRRPFQPPPEETFAPPMWAAMDALIFRPASELFTFEPARAAVDVNALDEVPDSSWYVNRISRRPMDPLEVARGACDGLGLQAPGPWRVVAGKLEGATPGFVFEDANGVRYVLKVDRANQPEQATAADAIVASVFHAAGYHVPCNRVVGFSPEMLVLDEDATIEAPDGSEIPMTEAHVTEVTDAASRLPNGRLRAVVSRYIDGTPLGPWSYRGTRDGDPNDVIPHDRRRELRGMYVLAAWVGRWDARRHNTLSAWIERERGGYVRHYVIDFGECLGLVEGNFRRARRFGHSQWLDFGHLAEDLFTFGLIHRPWDDPLDGPAHETFGSFDIEHFDPEGFRPDYWNGAFERRTEADSAWMARIIARLDRPRVRALADLGRFQDPAVEDALVQILMGRRERILERYLTRLSPLTAPEVSRDGDRSRVCLTDLAVRSGIRDAAGRRYRARAWTGDPLRPLEAPAVDASGDDGAVCVTLPALAPARPEAGYTVVDVLAETPGRETTGPARMHFVLGGDGAQLVGLERPADGSAPR